MIMQKSSVVEEPSSQLPEFIGIPLSMDLALHAVPALSLLLDFFAFEMPYFDLGAAVKLMVAFTLWYSTWVEYCGANNGTCEQSCISRRFVPITDNPIKFHILS
jgi:hypothetical protein